MSSELAERLGKAVAVADKLRGDEAAEDGPEAARAAEMLSALGASRVSVAALGEPAMQALMARLKQLRKHRNEAVATAAKQLLADWKAQVREEVQRQGTEDSKQHSQDVGTAAAAPKAEAVTPAQTGVTDTGSQLRNKYRQLLCDKLSIAVASEAGALLAPAQAADEIEEQLFVRFQGDYDQKEFKLKFRLIKDNLGDKSNPDFRRRVLEGEVTPVEVCEMNAEDMASDARKMENEKIRKHKLFHAEAGKPLQGTTDQFKCGKCKQRKCTYFQMQTRSADEPMTTFVTCTVCGNRWKFC
mmetsp:Transcript_11451/g.41914  ORF Transcript_11451/g.41914 Transcript_11451/m.41914 type:complete len:299 (+) Transcript_11451:209-1105(+)